MIVDEIITAGTVTDGAKAQRAETTILVIDLCVELERGEPAEQKIPLAPLSRNRVLNKL